MLRQCTVQYFAEIHELQTELSVFGARGVANFDTRCNYSSIIAFSHYLLNLFKTERAPFDPPTSKTPRRTKHEVDRTTPRGDIDI